jgi:S1-C subfamily serine protease
MTLSSLNEDLKALFDRASASVLEVRARRRMPSSGVAWSADGLVVAAEHTVEEEGRIEIATSRGETFDAEVVGRDPTTGVALLSAKKARLSVPEWRETSGLAAPELVVVVAASKAGRRASLAAASVVSGEWSTDSGGRIERYIETDARLFPGFSGSLALDANGRSIGIHSAGLRRRTPLVIPTETLRRVVGSLVEHGEVRRGFLGITTYPIRLPEEVKSQRVGLLVLSVLRGSPAHDAGLSLGDVILGVNGRLVESPAALLSELTAEKVGKRIDARILRTGREETISITVAARS